MILRIIVQIIIISPSLNTVYIVNKYPVILTGRTSVAQ